MTIEKTKPDMHKLQSCPALNLDTVPHHFEGAEKRLEVDFTGGDGTQGMRLISREKWDDLLASVNCLVMSVQSNEYMDSYVLSESSLFVYSHKIMIKTCGTTTLLECVPHLLEYADSVGLTVDFVTYSHKNFQKPERQLFPYGSNFSNEVDLLNTWFQGEGYVMGPLRGERWFIYVADCSKKESTGEDTEQTIEILMTELNDDAMSLYQFHDRAQPTGKEVTEIAGIHNIIPGSSIDEKLFDPCGYSMNAFRGAYYSTIHITPEKGFSYVSYETNLSCKSFDKIISTVLNIFKPGRFIVSVFADSASPCGGSANSFGNIDGFSLTCKSTNDFVGRRSVTCSHYVKSL